MKSEKLTRYELQSGTTRMNVLLDEKIPVGYYVTLNDEEFDSGKEWLIVRRHETIDRKSIKRKWNNNI